MSDNATITREQLRAVYIATELSGKTGDSSHFSYAELGSSTYSFGELQFDVGNSDSTKDFLRKNGFGATEIHDLGQHGGLSRERLDALDTKLQDIPQAKIDQFTNDQLDKKIAEVGHAIDQVRTQNPENADAITQDQKLQLGLADYANQFGSITPQLVEVLKGNAETLYATGVTIQAGNPPTRDNVQTFIDATKYGHNNARAVEGRAVSMMRWASSIWDPRRTPTAIIRTTQAQSSSSVLKAMPSAPCKRTWQNSVIPTIAVRSCSPMVTTAVAPKPL